MPLYENADARSLHFSLREGIDDIACLTHPAPNRPSPSRFFWTCGASPRAAVCNGDWVRRRVRPGAFRDYLIQRYQLKAVVSDTSDRTLFTDRRAHEVKPVPLPMAATSRVAALLVIEQDVPPGYQF